MVFLSGRDIRGTVGGGLLFGIVVLLAFAASASAEIRTGSAPDEVESGRLAPGRDIVMVAASYDTVAGTVTAAVTTAGPPEKVSTVALRTDFFPVDVGGECVAPEARVASFYGETAVAWQYGSAKGTGQKTISGNTTTLTATSPALANQPFFCMNAYVLEEVGGELKPIENLVPALKLSGPPPAPPAPAPPTPVPTPAPAPPAPPKVAALALIAPKTLTVRRNSTKKIKLTVANSGTATAGKVKLTVSKARGLTIKPKSGKFKLKSIAAGKAKSVSLKVVLTRRTKAKTVLPVTVTGAKGVKARGKIVLVLPHKRRGKPVPMPEPTPAKNPLIEKLFYGYKTETSESATLIGYAFLDETWAYHGIPAGGLPHCTEVTGNAETEGCVKYSYDPTTGAITIGSIAGGKIAAGGDLEIDGESFYPTAIPAPGTRYQLEQEYVSYSGLCGSFTGCTTSHERILLTANGEFVLTRESLSTAGGSGPGEVFVAAGSYPPDEHGTYAIEPMGRIHLSYADGTTANKTIAILLNPEGKPDPINEGFLLDSRYFTFAKT